MGKAYKKIQDRVGDITGPLGKLWVMVEKARTVADEDDPAELLSSEEVARTIEKTVTLVGQVFILATYERRSRLNFKRPDQKRAVGVILSSFKTNKGINGCKNGPF